MDSDSDEEEGRQAELVECTYRNPCCLRIEEGAKVVLLVDVLICILGTFGCMGGFAYQYQKANPRLDTYEMRLELMWACVTPVIFCLWCIVASIIYMCHRAAWACVIWVVAKVVMLAGILAIMILIFKHVHTYNESLTQLEPDYTGKKVHIDMKYVQILMIMSYVVLGTLEAWFIWIIGLHGLQIKENFLLDEDIATVFEYNRARVGQTWSVGDLGYLSGSTPREALITPAPLHRL